MSISVQNMIVLYRAGNDDSYAFAAYYADKRGLDYSQLIPVPCSGNEILNDYATFQSEIENAVKAELESEYGSENDINVILVGYGVPGGFRDGINIISTTSRLARVNHTYSQGFDNPLFARQQFKRYDDSDAQQALIVSRIDAPTLANAKAIVDRIVVVARQGTVNGTLFFDPYEVDTADEQEKAYISELADFELRILPILNMKVYKTTFWDQNTDVVIPQLKNDSFMWALKADRAGYTFFEDTKTIRVFLYNADLDGAGAVRDPDDKRWPMLALNAGYAACAGAMSDPLPEGFLRPKAFFDALFRGATIGEAFTYACPNLDWTMTLFGDPLVKVRFPSATILLEGFSTSAGFEKMERSLRSTMGYYLEREQRFIDCCDIITGTKDVDTLVDLLAPFTALANDIIAKTRNDFARLATEFINFPLTGGETMDQYLSTRGLKISQLLPIIYPSLKVQSRLIYPDGYWDFETNIIHPTNTFARYDFQLQLANDAAFTDLIHTGTTYTSTDNLVINADSSQSKLGWFYERESSIFGVVVTAIQSGYSGRRVRYVSPTVFPKRQIYYIRYRQKDEFGGLTSWQSYKQVIGT